MWGIVAVACSGGRDSLALLHATAVAARGEGLDAVALHIHHGLLPEADAWFDHVESMCRRWASEGLPVRFIGRRLTARPRRGESVEAWAREARYAALTDMAREAGAGLVLLGHHRKDQAETFLLQALRGAGVAGLSAMPACIERDGLVWQRPWLDVPRAHIEQYVQQCGLESVEDPSNTDPRFARNRLREAVWPALAAAFPDADVALAGARRGRRGGPRHLHRE
jgi:tRNA(Ile)-lysidine synthase